MKDKIVIYTSLPEYVKLDNRFKVRSYSFLSNSKWISDRIEEMSGKKSSHAEENFMRFCKSFRYNLFRQVYFKIGTKQYFLDFFIPSKNIAIEIDGPSHFKEEQKIHDAERDAAFLSIGIKTIRFSLSDMKKPKFYEKEYRPKLANIGFRIRPKEPKNDHQKRLTKAIAAIKSTEINSTIEFQSASLPFLQAISRKSPKQTSKDLPLLHDFYETMKEKRINVVCRFTGSMDNIKPGMLSWVKRAGRKCDNSEQGHSIVII